MDLERIAVAGGHKASLWLLESPAGQSNNSIRIYLSPNTQTHELRRGTAIELIRRQGQTAWTPSQTIQYAQLLKAGQDINSINGEQRPFTVSGSFSNDEIIGIVTLIRRSEGGARLLSLSGNGNSLAMITVTAPEGKVRLVSLQRKGSSWKVLQSIAGRP